MPLFDSAIFDSGIFGGSGIVQTLAPPAYSPWAALKKKPRKPQPQKLVPAGQIVVDEAAVRQAETELRATQRKAEAFARVEALRQYTPRQRATKPVKLAPRSVELDSTPGARRRVITLFREPAQVAAPQGRATKVIAVGTRQQPMADVSRTRTISLRRS